MKYVVANWKMNMDNTSLADWLEEFSRLMPEPPAGVEIIICPSFTFIKDVYNKNFLTGAQDVSPYEKGAHTGEVGALELKDFCRYCIVGHSERGEDLPTVIQKRDTCLKHKITPVVCFVEPDAAPQLYSENVILAWEDPQNISVGGVYRPKDPMEILQNLDKIRSLLPKESPLIYGGSVNRETIGELVKMKGLDGVLVGNASLDPAHFTDIIKACSTD
jgi:triosephosphate isomerase (TIM)